MATLTVRTPSKLDRIRIRMVNQRSVSLAAPWDDDRSLSESRSALALAMSGLAKSRDVLVAAVDDELCAYATFERGDEQFRWNVCCLGAGSPRVDASDDVAIELWSALLEESVRAAGRAGARRIFAFCRPDSAEQESLRQARYSSYTRYTVLRGTFNRGLREETHVREQHASDLWSIHQLYNRTTPRPVQFAEAFTSDTWAADSEPHIPFLHRKRLGLVVPTEDGIGAACLINLTGPRATVMVMCDDHLAHAIPSIVADSLELVSLHGVIDVVLPGYQLDLASGFRSAGFEPVRDVIGTVRHTTAIAGNRKVVADLMELSNARPAVSIPYQGLTYAESCQSFKDGA